jgi:23S rRNA pseudouridine1911/1915/1917 synthase
MSASAKSDQIIEPGPQPELPWADEDAALEAPAEWRQAPVGTGEHGQRLDRALTVLVPEFSRSYLQQLIEAGAVQCNGRVQTRSASKVKVDDVLGVELRPTPQSLAFHAERMDLSVVHEDEHMLVIDKPAGLVVHPAAGHWSGTLLNGLLAHHALARTLPRAGIVHRLDKDTSGLMVVAKTRAAMDALVQAIAQRRVRRQYLALAHRSWQGAQELRVDVPIGRDPRQRTRMAVVDLQHQSGKSASTDVRCLATAVQASFFHCQLHTGRTHQIRVHLMHLGHPILADELYGGQALAGMRRQALHAWRLSLDHPIGGQAMSWQSPLPPDIAQALHSLQLGPQPPGEAALQ